MQKEKSDLVGVSFHSTSTYTLVDEIGRGGMGIIFLAEKHTEGVEDKVVLKTVKALSTEHEERLKEEANVATSLRHENIVKTYGLESLPLHLLPEAFRQEIDSLSYAKPHRRYEHYSPIAKLLHKNRNLIMVSSVKPELHKDQRKLFFIAMDYIQGPDLSTLHHEHVRKGLLIPNELIGFVISRICRALAYAHKYIIHRDISPENVLIDHHGVCKLSDFGVAARTKEEMQMLAGKLSYMSPEQIRMEEIDKRTDIFALGLVAYEMLTGIRLYSHPWDLPFGEQRMHVLKQMEKEIIPPHQFRTDIPEILSLIVMKMLAKDKNQRYENMYDVGDMLEQKYLYAKGFGPTNNSLASYISMFYSNFEKYTNEQLRQLNFLKGAEGKLVLKRKIEARFYTPNGLKLVMSRPESTLAKHISKQMAGM
ncbi:MAG: serine/threonine protein kinase [Planctomycetes bacterium]|nr:serine/threonine protein kinase [Planctomycetota bacterium]